MKYITINPKLCLSTWMLDTVMYLKLRQVWSQESGEIINSETLHQEIEQEGQLNRKDDTSRETNPYKCINIHVHKHSLGLMLTYPIISVLQQP